MRKTNEKILAIVLILTILFQLVPINAFADEESSIKSIHFTGTTTAGTGLMDFVFGNGTYVATGITGKIITSTDKLTWAESTPAVLGVNTSITFANGLFVIVNTSGKIQTSTDGITWTARNSMTTESLTKVKYLSNNFVVTAGNGVILNSVDGITWTKCTVDTTTYIFDVAWDGDKYIAVGRNGIILTSTDALNWTTQANITSAELRAIHHQNGNYVIAGFGGTIFTSADGVSWTQQITGTTANFQNLAYLDGKYFALGGSYCIMSEDGVNWERLHSNVTSFYNLNLDESEGQYYNLNGTAFNTGYFQTPTSISTSTASVSLLEGDNTTLALPAFKDQNNNNVPTLAYTLTYDLADTSVATINASRKITAGTYIEGNNTTTLTITETNTGITKAIDITINPKVYNVAFDISGGNGATIAFAGQTLIADVNGHAVFNNVRIGNHAYNITAEGYAPASGSIDVINQDVTKNVVLQLPKYDVTFNIDDNGSPVQDAVVDFYWNQLNTDSTGAVTFSNITSNNGIAYTITKSGFVTENGTVDVINQDVIKDITLTPETYSVNFTVNAEGIQASGATVDFNGQTQTTDILGVVTFSNVRIANEIPYTVSRLGNDNITGTIDVVDQDVSKVSDLTASTYTVTLTVADENNPIVGADVSLNGNTVATDAEGQAVFNNVAIANNQPYTVTKTTFDTLNGTIDVVDQDVTKNVTLTASTYTVYFNVSDGTNPIADAEVEFNNESKNTDGSGAISFNNVAIGNEAYTISKEGFVDATGTVNVIDQNVAQNVTLTTIPAPTPEPTPNPEPSPTPEPTPTPLPEKQPSGSGNNSGSTAPVLVVTPEPITTKTENSTKTTTITEIYMTNALDKNKNVIINVQAEANVNQYSQALPASALTGSIEHTVTINTPFADIKLSGNMMQNFANKDNKSVVIGIKSVETYDKPAVDITARVDGNSIEWSNLNAPVKIAIPYTPITGEDINNILVAYMKNGKVDKIINNAKYNADIKKVEFTTTHFSEYKVIYNSKEFEDVKTHWAKNEVEQLASKGIINGVGNNKFNPKGNMTRADFTILLQRLFDLQEEVTENFADIKNDAYYYNAVAIAKKLGITAGVQGSKFRPTDSITREEMAVMLSKGLQIHNKKLKLQTVDISKFTDAKMVSVDAIESMKQMVAEGIIRGSNGNLNPQGIATRAEASTMMFRVLEKYIIVK